MKHILLTGATGFLGNVLKKSLERENNAIFSLGRHESNDYVYDLSVDVPLLSDLVDIVIHSAGKAHSVPVTPQQQREFFQVNYQGTIHLCNAIESLTTKPKAFIFISTVAVYGLDVGSSITESTPLKGITPYAKSKIQAEEYLQEWAKKHDITLSILRLPLIVGPNPPGNLGAMIKGIQTGRYLSIGKACARKSMIWAEDISEIIPQLTTVGGIYNLTDGYHPSFGELENSISVNLGKKSPLKIPIGIARLLGKVGDFLGRRFPVNSEKINKITSSLTFDDSKARKALNWDPSKILNKISEIVCRE